MAGDWGDDLAGVQRTERSADNGTPVSSSSGPRSRTREGIKARGPRARERAAVVISAGNAGLTVLREGWQPEGARRWAFDSGSTRSATARPRAAGTRPPTACPRSWSSQPPRTTTAGLRCGLAHRPTLVRRAQPGVRVLRRRARQAALARPQLRPAKLTGPPGQCTFRTRLGICQGATGGSAFVAAFGLKPVASRQSAVSCCTAGGFRS